MKYLAGLSLKIYIIFNGVFHPFGVILMNMPKHFSIIRVKRYENALLSE
jgi:hypothetical protein